MDNFPRSINGAIGGLTSKKHPIICGGEQGFGESSDCFTYVNGAWNSSPSMTSPRFGAAVTPYPKETHSLLVTGGYYAHSGNINTTEVLSDDGWQELSTHLPIVIAYHCMVLLNSTTIIIIGGYQDDDRNSPHTYFFNTENEEWSPGPDLLYGRSWPSCGKLQKESGSSEECVIVAGGESGTPSLISSVEILDFGGSDWKNGPSLPSAIWGASMVEVSGGVVLIGGNNGTALDTLYQLSHANSEWVLMPQKLKECRGYATAFLVPDEITNCN